MRKVLLGILATVVVSALSVQPAQAQRLCDPAGEDCREILLNLIRAETVGIDVAFWFMEDSRYSAELVRRANAGVPVRVLVDTSANAGHPINAQVIEEMRQAGIPIRRRNVSSILHWKMMLFAGQGQVEFSGANYSPNALTPDDPYRNYVDEAILFTDDPAIVHSFMQRYDDLWTDTVSYANYANVTTLKRRYPRYPLTPEMNFPPLHSYRDRAVAAYNAERTEIDAIMYRITDRAHTDAIINAVQRGVRVRLITEQAEYRNRARLWDAWNKDRLWMAGIEMRQRAHAGLNHQKSVILRSQQLTIFGSSNWTSPSNQSQEEHNLFTTRAPMFEWFRAQFERKWANSGPAVETQVFVPLPPDEPAYGAPANGGTASSTTPTLQFQAGPFAHLYDIYLGTSTTPGLIAVNVELGPSEGGLLSYTTPALAPGTRYYWRVIAKTMALQPAGGPVWSFTTPGAPGPAPGPLPSPDPVPTPNPNPNPDPAPSPAPGPPDPAPAPSPSPSPSPMPTPRPTLVIDVPGQGVTVRQPFSVAGWALDLAASDNGIDLVHVYAYPADGSDPIFLGATPVNFARPDVGAIFGGAHGSAGYGMVVRGLKPGDYMLAVFGHSSFGAGFPVAQGINIRVERSTLLALDAPGANAVLGQRFLIGGWAADFSAASGSGIDLVHAYAYPLDAAGDPIFLGSAMIGSSRPDVAAYFGAAYERTGFNLTAPSLNPGRYQIVVFGRSLVSGGFDTSAWANVTVR